jgi:SAM-dependent methyltransferase
VIRSVGLMIVSGATNPGDASAGRKTWLSANVAPTESVVELGGTGELFAGWHQGVTALDDLSGFGPGHRIAAKRFIKGDIAKTPFANHEFDVAVVAEVLEHVPCPVACLREAARVAKRVLITTPFENRWTNPAQWRIAGHIRFYTPPLFCAQVRKAGLSGDVGILEFTTWSFLVAVLSQDGVARDRYARPAMESLRPEDALPV